MIFDRLKGKAKQDEDADKGASNRPNKKKNKQLCKGSLVATTDRKGGRKPMEGTLDHFEKLLEGHARTIPSPSSIYTRTVAS